MSHTINQDLQKLNSLINDSEATTSALPEDNFSNHTSLTTCIQTFTKHVYKQLSTTFVNQLQQKNQVESLSKEVVPVALELAAAQETLKLKHEQHK